MTFYRDWPASLYSVRSTSIASFTGVGSASPIGAMSGPDRLQLCFNEAQDFFLCGSNSRRPNGDRCLNALAITPPFGSSRCSAWLSIV